MLFHIIEQVTVLMQNGEEEKWKALNSAMSYNRHKNNYWKLNRDNWTVKRFVSDLADSFIWIWVCKVWSGTFHNIPFWQIGFSTRWLTRKFWVLKLKRMCFSSTMTSYMSKYQGNYDFSVYGPFKKVSYFIILK